VRQQVEEIIGTGSPRRRANPFTPRAKKVLELSLREALQLGHNYIGTEHILLGLIREGEGVAAQVLQKLGADLGRVRQQVIQLLSGYGSTQEQRSGEQAAPSGSPSSTSSAATSPPSPRATSSTPSSGARRRSSGDAGPVPPDQEQPRLIGEPRRRQDRHRRGPGQRIVKGEVPETLSGKQIYTLDLGALVAGSRYRV